MDVKFFFKGVSSDEKVKAYVEKRLSSVEKMLATSPVLASVEVEEDKKGMFRVEVTMKTPKDIYRAEETSKSIEGSVDMTEEELKTQIRRKKDKLMTMIRRGGRSIKKKFALDEKSRF